MGSTPTAAQAAAMLSQLTPAQLAVIPVAPPPPGVIPNFAHPATRLPDLLGVGIPFFAIATAVFGIRVYMKAIVLKKWRVEDTTLSIGFLITFAYYVLMCYGATSVNVGRHIYELHLSTMYGTQGFWIGVWLSSIPAQIAFGFIKTSLFLQFYHLFKSTYWLKMCITAGLVFNVLFYLAFTLTLIVLQSPWPGESVIAAAFSDHIMKCQGLFLPTGIIGVIIDWYLLLLPIPAVLSLKLSASKKIGVLAIFMTGSLACISSIISLYYRTTLATILEDPTWGMVTIINWIFIELVCGVIACCMPTLNLFWNRTTGLSKFGSKVKTSFRSMLRISRTRSGGYSYPITTDKPGKVNLRAPPVTASDQTMTKDEILVIQGYSVDSSSMTRNDSHSSQEEFLKDVEAQKHRSELW